MKKTVILIDGENFQYKVKQVIEAELGKEKVKDFDLSNIQLDNLLKVITDNYSDLDLVGKNYYAGKIHEYIGTIEKSKALIKSQRILKTNLEKQGFDFILAGHVRAQLVTIGNQTKPIFKEKGVDVRIAVDMVSMACDQKVDSIIVCSSDSDLQPAVKEVKKRGVEVIYLGFSVNPNKGLTFTTDKTILFRNPEIINTLFVK